MPYSPLLIEGCPLHDVNGYNVGTVAAVYRYPADLDAPWGVAAVNSGSIIRSTHLVDLFDARFDAGTLVVTYPIEKIKAAPRHRATAGETLEEDHGARVLSHYRGSLQLV